jgi:hypothetical protein
MNCASSSASCSKRVLKNPITRQSLLAVTLIALAGATGCGESSNEVAVEGRVTYRGAPLETGSLTFFPSKGRPVSASLAEEGEYELALPPGQYTVTVNVGPDLPPGFREGDPVPPPKIVLPPEYTTRAKSRLTAAVRQGDEQPINFELK